jgi:hypothetical protein
MADGVVEVLWRRIPSELCYLFTDLVEMLWRLKTVGDMADGLMKVSWRPILEQLLTLGHGLPAPDVCSK